MNVLSPNMASDSTDLVYSKVFLDLRSPFFILCICIDI